MSEIFEKMNSLIKNNKRVFKNSDAKYCYYDLITNAQIEEFLAYNLCYLLDKLQFSAYEMWVKASDLPHKNSITLQEVMFLILKLPENISNFSYYSNELTAHLIELFNILKTQSHRTFLEEHLYRSLSKEIFTYRAGHDLVKGIKNGY